MKKFFLLSFLIPALSFGQGTRIVPNNGAVAVIPIGSSITASNISGGTFSNVTLTVSDLSGTFNGKTEAQIISEAASAATNGLPVITNSATAGLGSVVVLNGTNLNAVNTLDSLTVLSGTNLIRITHSDGSFTNLTNLDIAFSSAISGDTIQIFGSGTNLMTSWGYRLTNCTLLAGDAYIRMTNCHPSLPLPLLQPADNLHIIGGRWNTYPGTTNQYSCSLGNLATNWGATNVTVQDRLVIDGDSDINYFDSSNSPTKVYFLNERGNTRWDYFTTYLHCDTNSEIVVNGFNVAMTNESTIPSVTRRLVNCCNGKITLMNGIVKGGGSRPQAGVYITALSGFENNPYAYVKFLNVGFDLDSSSYEFDLSQQGGVTSVSDIDHTNVTFAGCYRLNGGPLRINNNNYALISSVDSRPANIAVLSLTNQTTSINGTIAPIAQAGMYRVTVYLTCTTAGSGGTVTATVGWTDEIGAKSITTSTLALTADTGVQQASYVFRGQPGAVGTFVGNDITYATTVAGATGSPKYRVDFSVDILGGNQ